MFVYKILSSFFYPILVFIIFFRKLFKKEHPIRYKEKIFTKNFNIFNYKDKKLIWFHAASVGEMKSIIPVLQEINRKSRNFYFLITTVTLSSSVLAEDEFSKLNNVIHRFLPLDINFLMEEFFLKWKPSYIFLVDSEIWPNLILNAKKNKVPLALINGRITPKTFKRWNLFPKTAEKIFGSFDMCLSANLETKKFLKNLKAKNITYSGNIKLINRIDIEKIKNLNDKKLISIPFWCAISTHEGEEFFCLQSHKILKNEFDKLITIIAPRHIDRVNSIQRICEKLGLKSQILNKDETILDDMEVIIINSFGVLPEYLKYAKSVFIGKSSLKNLKNDSGQSPIDAAKLGCKIYHGPYVSNFEDIYEILEKNSISKKIYNPRELAKYLQQDLTGTNKKNNQFNSFMFELEQKVLNTTMQYVNNFLNNENKQA